MAIKFSSLVSASIPEGLDKNVIIYTAQAGHDDSSTAVITYSLASGSDDALIINPSTGQILLTEAPDFETQAAYSFTVVATDADGQTTEHSVTVALTDAVEGSASDDAFEGTAADDLFDGGDGADKVTYTGNLARYVLGKDVHGNLTITDTATKKKTGTENLIDIESIVFADKTLTVTEGLSFVSEQAVTSKGAFQNAIDALAFGGFVSVWRGEDASGYGILAQVFDSSGTASGNVINVNTTTTNTQRIPAVAGLSDGRFVVTWESSDQDGSGYGIFGQIYDARGAAQGSEFQINTASNGSQRYANASALENGRFIVVWQDENSADGSGDGIFGQIFDASGAKEGSELSINTVTAGTQRYPDVSLLSDGGFVAVWQGDRVDANGWGIQAQRFNSSGVAVGDQFSVNTHTAGSQDLPEVAGLENGVFFVFW